MPRPVDSTTATGAKRVLLMDLLEASGTPNDKSESLADELIPKFKWIARSISMYFDTARVLTAYEERDEDEAPATDAEKKQHKQFLALHPHLPEFVKALITDPGSIDDLGKVIDHHVSEAKNSDTNTLRHLIAKLLPENPNRDVIDPPITGKTKNERGFNHRMTGAMLCPLKFREQYDEDPIAFNNNVNAGELTMTLDNYPSGLYPPNTPYDDDAVEEKLFQGYPFIRALRAIYSGEESVLDGMRSAAKASQAEMHQFTRVTPEAAAYVGVHLIFALTDIENWSVAHHSAYDFPTFFQDMVRIFPEPEDEWGKETLDFLTKQLPPLRKKQMKRKRHARDEGQGGERDDDTTRSLRNREARRARAAEQRQREAQIVQQPRPSTPARQPRHSSIEDNNEESPRERRQLSSTRRVVQSPSPEPEQPPQSSPPSSPAPQSSPPRPQQGLMGPPPPRYPNTLTELTNNIRLPRRPSFLSRNRSPTQEPEVYESHALSSRRSTLRNRSATKVAPAASKETAAKASTSQRRK